MKKTCFAAVAASLLVAFVAAGCGKPQELAKEYVTVVPSPVEAHAGKVNLEVKINYPVKYFQKKMELTLTPMLANETDTLTAPNVYYQGEKVTNNNTVVEYKVGGPFSFKTSFNYDEKFKKSKVLLKVVANVKDKVYDLGIVEIADGVIATSELVNFTELTPAVAADNFQRIITERTNANIKFLIQQSEIRSSELSTEELKSLIKKIDEAKKAQNQELKGIEISSYASPDGAVELNEKLASRRESETNKYIAKQLKKLKAEVSVDSKFTAEDWDGFQSLMQESEIDDKEVILRVLSMYQDPEEREREIKNIANVYKSIADEILPQLRRSKMTLAVDVIGKSDEEIKELAKNNPDSLSQEELLYSGTLFEDVNDKIEIYNKSIERNENDWRAYNNLAASLYKAGKIDDADRMAARAVRLKGDAPEANFNAGLTALANNQLNTAEEYFGKSANVGDKLELAQGALLLKRAEYRQAASTLSGKNCNNEGLAKLMNGDYSGARSVLNGIEDKDATTYYLLAVLGARVNDRSSVFENLKLSVEKNADNAACAKKDAEFAAYFEDENFKAIVD